jgi:putative redox protein
MHFEGFTDDPDADRFAIQLDSDSASGGHGEGMRPVKMLLVSLAGCMGMDVISILRKKQQQVSGFEVSVRGERADEHPRVYTDIQVFFTITGLNVDEAAVERAISLSYDKYCPIANLIKPVVPIQTHYEIVEG